MARKISRAELILLLEELNQGKLSNAEMEQLVMELEFLVSNDEAVDLLQNDRLSHEEIADQLVGYDPRDV